MARRVFVDDVFPGLAFLAALRWAAPQANERSPRWGWNLDLFCVLDLCADGFCVGTTLRGALSLMTFFLGLAFLAALRWGRPRLTSGRPVGAGT